jgi:23S rRNA (uracil1939-C5)-methyltransferase
MDIILASESERRFNLLKKIIPEFRVIPSNIPEESAEKGDPIKYAVQQAEQKATSVGRRYPESVVIGADTVVCVNDLLLGKPHDYDEAVRFLRLLSGRKHRVVTAVCVYRAADGKKRTEYEITEVVFKTISDNEIEEYLSSHEFLDKAGSYAVQEIGDSFIEQLEGDYDNVVGFPTRRVARMLQDFTMKEQEIEITDIAFPNDYGVGRMSGLVVFVPKSVPGDIITIGRLKKRGSFAYAECKQIVCESPDRVKPECPHFGTCGGCIMQHISYSRQVELKRKFLFENLSKIGRVNLHEPEKIQIVKSPELSYYRNKMEFAFGESDGKTILGLRRRADPFSKSYHHEVLQVSKCTIFSAIVERTFPVFIEYAERNHLAPFDPYKQSGFLRHLVIREGKNTGQVLVILVTRTGELPDCVWLAERLIEAVPELTSLWHVENDQISDVVAFERKHHLLGKTFIQEKIKNFTFKIGPQTFFQPNTHAAELLYETIMSFAAPSGSERVLGLYCGSGPIEIFLAQKAGMVHGIDSNDANITSANDNCRTNQITNCTFSAGLVEKLLKNVSGDYELLVLDPPRGGLSGKTIRKIIETSIPRIIYVSCNPATLARDIKLFADNKYSLKNVTMVDMFPHTGHTESVCLIEKA